MATSQVREFRLVEDGRAVVVDAWEIVAVQLGYGQHDADRQAVLQLKSGEELWVWGSANDAWLWTRQMTQGRPPS